MCLLVFAWRVHPEFPLVFAGNRDEFHDRPGNDGICPSSPEAAMLMLARQRLRPLEQN